MPVCYIASPLGFNDAGRSYYYEHYLPELAKVCTPVDPWVSVSPTEVADAETQDKLRELWLRVGRARLDAIAKADGLVAWLDGQEIDSGTCIEIGYAVALRVPCYGLRTDLRQAGEAEMAVNLQVETTIVTSGGRVVSTLDELVACLARLGTGRD